MFVRRRTPGFFQNDFDQLRRDMSALFDAVSGGPLATFDAGVFPALNVTQDKDNYYVRAEIPGASAEALEISAVHRTLSVSGNRAAAEEEGASYHRRERAAGRFSRSVTLPTEFDTERVAARFVNGLLTVTLPKAEKAKPRQITVRSA